MRKSFSMLVALVLLTFISTCLFPAVQVGEEVRESIQSPREYKAGSGLTYEKTIHYPNAGYIAIHFSNFNLDEGDYVEITSGDERARQRYTGKGKVVRDGRARIADFWATHIPGDTAVIRFVSKNYNGTSQFSIDKWVRGYERRVIESILRDVEAICTSDDKEEVKCYEGTTMYDKSRAVCRILINGSSACTGWLVGSEGHVMTNNHCIGTQSEADNSDFEFMAEGSDCATSCVGWFNCPGTVEASSGTLVQADSDLDYALVLLPVNVSPTYGYMQLRQELPTVGERIYIPQHAGGSGKQIAVNSDTDGPFCSVYSTNESPCMAGPGDIGYYADTEGGSSGSPVLGYADNLVVALHHCAYCPNRGVPIPAIITDLGINLPANALGGIAEEPPVADFSANFTTIQATQSVQFTDLSTQWPDSWAWTFEGGTPASSTNQNPIVVYAVPGTYTVTLTATNTLGADTASKVGYITVTPLQLPVVDFTASATTIEAGNTITFTDLSTNMPSARAWSFEGGTPEASTEQNPTITYNTMGTYSVTLTVTNGAGDTTETKTDYITVTEAILDYCASQGNSQSDEYIGEIQVGSLVNASGASAYTDFTSVVGEFAPGETLDVLLTQVHTGYAYTEYWTIWIDFNVDGDFEDAGEEVFSGSGTTPVAGSFTLPDVVCEETRMRISMKWGSYSTPCEVFSYGEVEDYTVKIGGGSYELSDFSIFASNSIYMRTAGKVHSGHIGVNGIGVDHLDGAVEVSLANNIFMADNVSVYADKLKMKSGTSVDNVFYNTIYNYDATIRGVETTPLELPPGITMPVFPTPAPGTDVVNVPVEGVVTLAAGAYGDVVLDTKATLVLSGGTYHFESLGLGDYCQMLVQAGTELIVNGNLVSGENPVIGLEAGAAVTAKDFVIYVNG
ncbi:MAG: PKD domain-containing protein, partial [bacterium]|nr:PKD domain-containing protein [bacterium]